MATKQNRTKHRLPVNKPKFKGGNDFKKKLPPKKAKRYFDGLAADNTVSRKPDTKINQPIDVVVSEPINIQEKVEVVDVKSSYEVDNKLTRFYSGGNVQLIPDLDMLVCMNRGAVNLFNYVTCSIQQSFEYEEEQCTTFCYLSKTKQLVIASNSLVLRQYSMNEAELEKSNVIFDLVKTWKSYHRGPMHSLATDQSCTLLATASMDKTVKIWHLTLRYCTHNFKHESPVRDVWLQVLPPDSVKTESDVLCLTAGMDSTLSVWSLRSSTRLAVISDHSSAVTDVAFCSRRRIMVLTSADRTMSVFDTAVGIKLRKIFPAYRELVRCFRDPDETSDYFITADRQGDIAKWDVLSGALIESFHVTTGDDVGIVNMLNDTKRQRILCTDTEQSLIFINPVSKRVEKHLSGDLDEILDVCLLLNDAFVCVAANSNALRVLPTAIMSSAQAQGDDEDVNEKPNLEDTNWGSCLLVSPTHDDTVTCLAANVKSDDVFASGGKDAVIKVWRATLPLSTDNNTVNNGARRLPSVELLQSLTGHTAQVLTLRFLNSSDSFLSSGVDKTLKLWTAKAKSGTVAEYLCENTVHAHDKDVNCVSVSANDAFVATASTDRTARVWHRDGLVGRRGALRGHTRTVWSCAFSPTEPRLATASADGTAKVWCLETMTALLTLQGHDAAVLTIGYLAKGLQLFTTAADGSAKLWTVKYSECVQTLDCFGEAKVWSCAISKACNEAFIIAGTADGELVKLIDKSEKARLAKADERTDSIEKQQLLDNLTFKGDYTDALAMAIKMDRPSTALQCLKKLTMSIKGRKELQIMITDHLEMEDVCALLKYCREWNTNTKFCVEAQFALEAILKSYSIEELLKYREAVDYIQALLPYTERHFARYRQLQKETVVIDYLKTVTEKLAESTIDDSR